MIDSNLKALSRTTAFTASLVVCALAACTLSPPQPPVLPQPAGTPAGPFGSSGSTGANGSTGSAGATGATGSSGSTGGPVNPLGPIYGPFVNGDFESGTLTGWNTTGNVVVTASSHTGNYAAQLGGTRTTHLNTLAQSFQLPADASWISFWYRSDCDDETDDGETFATLANVDSSGASLTLLAPSCTEGGSWLQAMAQVTSYAGTAVTLRFSAGSSASASAATLLIDDVQISIAAATPISSGCNTDAECGAGTVCVASTCEPVVSTGGSSCTFDLQCGTWQVCTAGVCVVAPPDPTGCDSDIECGTGEVCEGGQCTDASYSPAPGDSCDTNADCGAMSCSSGVCTVDGDSGSGSTGTAGSGDDGSGSGSTGDTGGDSGSGSASSGDDGSGCGDSGSASSGDGSGDDGSGDGDDGSGDDGSGDDGSGDKHHSNKHDAKRRHAKHDCRRPGSSAKFNLTVDLLKR